MKNGIRYKSSLNPALSLIPLLFFVFFEIFSNSTISLLSGLVISIIMTLIDSHKSKSDTHPIIMLSITISFLCSFLVSLISMKLHYIIVEIFILIQMILIISNKKRGNKIIYRNEKKRRNRRYRNFVYEFFNFSNRLSVDRAIYIISAAVFIYNSKPQQYAESITLVNYVRLGMYFLLFINESIRIILISKKFESETWLPIIDNNMNVIGRVARSISNDTRTRFLHPRLRVLVFYKGRILLKPIEEMKLEKEKYDSPLFRDMAYGETLPKSLSKLLDRYELKNEKASFITRYFYEDDSIRRIVFLYIVHIKDEKEFKKHIAYKTKFWTESEIRNNINKNILGDFLEQEYELLDTIIYPSIKIMNDDGFNNDTWANSIGEDISIGSSGSQLEN